MLEAVTACGFGPDRCAGCAFFAITGLRRIVAACVVGAHSCSNCIEALHHAFRSVKIKSNFRQGFVKVPRELLKKHRETYRTFWEWSDRVVAGALLSGTIRTVFGWCQTVTPVDQDLGPPERSLRNFPMQANGAEMMRLACCLATERGVEVCMPVHDAMLIEADTDDIDAAVEVTRDAMREASRLVLGGFEVGTDAEIVRYPDRYSDSRGRGMWERVTGLLRGITVSV